MHGDHVSQPFTIWFTGLSGSGKSTIGQKVAEALQQQSRGPTSITLGQILLNDGILSRENLEAVLRSQIEDTIFELVTWQSGRFDFEVDDLAPIDELAVVPREILEDLDLDTQFLLLEATRLFDERSKTPVSRDLYQDQQDTPPECQSLQGVAWRERQDRLADD